MERDEQIAKTRETLANLFRQKSVTSLLDNSVHDLFPTSISAEEGDALVMWIGREQAWNAIEVGLGYGVSALFICEGLLSASNETVHHVVIDPFQTSKFKDCGLQNLAEAQVAPLVEHHAELSQIALPKFRSEKRVFDFAFVDGCHHFDAAFIDLMNLGQLVRGGGIIFVDDYQLPSVKRAVYFCVNNLSWTVEEISPLRTHHQWAVLRLPEKPVDRPYGHFVHF